MSASSLPTAHVVLVGGGHTHVQVLRGLVMDPRPDLRHTVVLDRPIAVYSGMVPGFVAGQVSRDELEIDIVPLARRAGAAVVLSAAVGVDPVAQRIALEGRPPIAYDIASFDIGSSVAGLDLPGVRANALATRPIGRFVHQVEQRLEVLGRRSSGMATNEPQVVVVGGGAGGVELAFSLEARIARRARASVTLLHASSGLQLSPALGRQVEREATARGIQLRAGRAVGASADSVRLANGDTLHCDLLVWAAGAAAPDLFERSSLPTDARGYVRTRSTLQVEGFDTLFAVGDCAHLVEHPDLPKAGVYAVRQGPTLRSNLRALATDPNAELERFEPQRDFLTLLNLGDGRALGAKWGLALGGAGGNEPTAVETTAETGAAETGARHFVGHFVGRAMFRWKTHIDRRFVRRFQVLDADGAPSDAFPPMATEEAHPGASGETGGGEMTCGGCAAKASETTLHRALARLRDLDSRQDERLRDDVVLGLDQADDVAAFRLPGQIATAEASADAPLLVATVDAFRAFTDDPYLVGRVAAVNAVSDLQAKGVAPRHLLALVTLPEAWADTTEGEEMLFQVLAGMRATLEPLGAALAGGHTTTGTELTAGLVALGWGTPPLPRLGALDASASGRRLILTRALGTGVLLHADAMGRARGPWLAAALDSMQRTNGAAGTVAREAGARAVTDVTGFGLVGHLAALLGRESAPAAGHRIGARIDLDSLPALPGALTLLARGERSTSHERNRAARPVTIDLPSDRPRRPRLELAFDPQTAGGLLFDVAPERVRATLDALHAAGETAAAVVGELIESSGDSPGIVLAAGHPSEPA